MIYCDRWYMYTGDVQCNIRDLWVINCQLYHAFITFCQVVPSKMSNSVVGSYWAWKHVEDLKKSAAHGVIEGGMYLWSGTYQKYPKITIPEAGACWCYRIVTTKCWNSPNQRKLPAFVCCLISGGRTFPSLPPDQPKEFGRWRRERVWIWGWRLQKKTSERKNQ